MIPVKNTVLTPELNTDGKKEGLKTGTTTVGIICKDCVVLAADRRATAGHMIANKRTQKVLKVMDHICVTIAGSVSDLQLLYKYLTSELNLKQRRDGRRPSVKEAANLLSAWVYKLIRSTYGVTHFIVGGYDDEPRLFDVYPDGSSMDIEDFVASGSGSVFVLGALENRFEKNLSKDDGVELAMDAMNAALARDSGSGNGIDIFVIDKDGAEHVVSKEIKSTA